MGNHTIAERMYRHDPRTMLCTPLRTVRKLGALVDFLGADVPEELLKGHV
jgi:hypothetical protein